MISARSAVAVGGHQIGAERAAAICAGPALAIIGDGAFSDARPIGRALLTKAALRISKAFDAGVAVELAEEPGRAIIIIQTRDAEVGLELADRAARAMLIVKTHDAALLIELTDRAARAMRVV